MSLLKVRPAAALHKGPGALLSGTALGTETIDGELRIKNHRQVWHVMPVKRQDSE